MELLLSLFQNPTIALILKSILGIAGSFIGILIINKSIPYLFEKYYIQIHKKIISLVEKFDDKYIDKFKEKYSDAGLSIEKHLAKTLREAADRVEDK